MNRIRNLTEKALRQLPDHEKQILSVNSFCQGLKNRNIAGQVAALAPNSTAKATRLASELCAYDPSMVPRCSKEIKE